MGKRTVSQSDARSIAEDASDCTDGALAWKERALRAEGLVARFCHWVDRADDPADDCAYLNGCHPDQRKSDRDGWDDLRDLRREADGVELPEADAFLVEWHRDGETWVHAHADEPTAIDQARKHGGTCTPLYRLPPPPQTERG